MPDYDENAEIVGTYIIAAVESAGDVSPVFENKMRKMFLDELDADDIDTDEWYNLGAYARAVSRVREEVGAKTMEEAGRAAGETAVQGDVSSVEEAFELLDSAHRSAIRGSHKDYPAGQYVYEITGPGEATVGIKGAFPFDEGDYVKGVFAGVVSSVTDTTPQLGRVDSDLGEITWRLTW